MFKPLGGLVIVGCLAIGILVTMEVAHAKNDDCQFACDYTPCVKKCVNAFSKRGDRACHKYGMNTPKYYRCIEFYNDPSFDQCMNQCPVSTDHRRDKDVPDLKYLK